MQEVLYSQVDFKSSLEVMPWDERASNKQTVGRSSDSGGKEENIA